MAAPTLQAEDALVSDTSLSITPVIPANLANDWILWSIFFWGPNTAGSAAVIPTPSGLTKLAEVSSPATPDGHIALFALLADADEADVTFTRGASWDTGTDTLFAGRAYVVRGAETSGNGWDEVDPTGALTAANGSCDAITVSGSERTVIQFHVKTDDFVTAPTISGWTAGTAVETASGTDGSFCTFRKDNVSADTSADASTVEAPGAGFYCFIGVSFKPPAAAATEDPFPYVSGGYYPTEG